MGGRGGFSPEQIIGKLREAEVLLSKGASIAEVYRRWRKRYGAIKIAEAKGMKELEENVELYNISALVSSTDIL